MKRSLLFLLLSLTIPNSVLSAPGIDPVKLLLATDRARGGTKSGITWGIKVTTVENGETSDREFLIKAKEDNAYVEATEPSRTKGEVYIFNDRNMWFYKPSLRKPVAISARQKLSGQAANGDIASTHYARDYSPTIEKTEKSANGGIVDVLLLKAKSNNLTYDQIRYWVDEKTQLAIKAEFLTLQGNAFKVASMEYNNKLKTGKQILPFVSRLTISDAKFPQNKSVIDYRAPKIENLNDSIFNINNLAR